MPSEENPSPAPPGPPEPGPAPGSFARPRAYLPPGDPVGFAEAFRRVYFRRPFWFSGRASRSEFWLGTLSGALVAIAVLLVVGVISVVDAGEEPGFLTVAFSLAFFLLWIFQAFATLTCSVRRLRDGGFNPWLLLLHLVPGGSISVFTLLVLSPPEFRQAG